MEASARRKVRGGKLLSVHLEHDGRTVTGAELSGDFFLFPEESISVMERTLVGISLLMNEEDLASMVDEVMVRDGIVAIGFDAGDLAGVVREALG